MTVGLGSTFVDAGTGDGSTTTTTTTTTAPPPTSTTSVPPETSTTTATEAPTTAPESTTPATEPPSTASPLAVPGPPQGVHASSMDDGVHISWSAPSSGGPVAKYSVQMSSPGCGKWDKATYTWGATDAHVGGLTAGQSYCFMVLAWNEAGFSVPSGSATVTVSGEGGDHGESPEHPMPEHPSGHPMGPDVSELPPPLGSTDGVVIGPQVYAPRYMDGVGAFRINCTYSHLNYDDPIVYPGDPGAAHLHLFFGNDSVDADSTADSIATTGGSTCTGGTANRSAYWVPAIIDANGQVVVSTDENALQVYYKTGYLGVASNEVVNFPAGLRMIAGDMSATTAGDMSVVRYSCLSQGDYSPSIPECAAGDVMVMTVQFPQCWDGVNLDSADHQSHMAYASPSAGGCPASHPVPLPEVTQNFRYTVPPDGMNGWRLASDMYDGAAGYSGHADWFNGWDASIFQRVIDNCYARGLDCLMNNLGDGTRLE